MKNLSTKMVERLEIEFVDKYDLYAVLIALSEIAAMKADHLRENWQDAASARAFDADSKAIEKCALKLRTR